MGLDMYLFRVPKGSTIYKSEDEIATLAPSEREYVLPPAGQPFNGTPTRPVHRFYHADGVEEVGYWRKANAIHAWFVNVCGDGVDECQPIPVHPEQIVDLYHRCVEVLDDHSKAEKLLSTTPGFFFGTTEYDEWYYTDLEATVKLIDELGATAKPGTELVYQASW